MKRLLVAAAGLLALFHVWVFGSQLWTGQLADPGLIVRWLIAAGLVAAIVALRRGGESVFWGRKAVSIWLLAAVLHGPALADAGQAPLSHPALPGVVTTLLQVATAGLLGVGLALAAAWLRTISTPRLRRAYETMPRGAARRAHHPPRFAPRPPPHNL